MTGQRLKVLFIGPLPDPVTGQSLACQVLLQALQTRCDVDVVNLSKAGFRQGIDSASRVREVLQIIRQIRARQGSADAIYFTISQSLAGNAKDLVIYAACFSRLHRMVAHLHGGEGMRELMRRGWLRRLNAFFLRRLRAVVVLGERSRGIFADMVPAGNIHLVPNFAEDGLFAKPEVIAAKFAQMRPLRVLFLSNLLPSKGHAELLQAFAALDPAVREALRIDFAGGFESEQAQRAFTADIAAFPQLRYHGTVRGEQKRALFWAAHVFCLPTYYPYEGQPISILEGYAAGCAVITTDHSGIFDVFTNGINGLAVEKRSAASLQAALSDIVRDPGKLVAMALHNHRTALHQYTTARYNESLLRIVLDTGAPSGVPLAAASH